MGKLDNLDKVIASNIKRFRTMSKLSQPQVAEHLGVTYQSYQKLEAGRISFRASTLDRLAKLYNKRLFEFIEGGEAEIDPMAAKAQILLNGMDDAGREEAIRALLIIKHRKP